MNRYDIRNTETSATFSYTAEAPMDLQPEWGESPEIVATDITYEWELSECRRKRAAEYPAIGDQLDAIYKRDHLDEPMQWQQISAAIDDVKARYPKPTPPVTPPPFNPPPESPEP